MTPPAPASRLDQHLRLRLADLDDAAFERFFLNFLNAGISLAIERDGKRVELRVVEANTYAAGTGRAQKGIDLIAKMEGGETWAFQCKRHQTWTVAQTQKAVAKVTHPAQHYFLFVACDPHKDVQDEMEKHRNWSFWNLDRICQEFRMRVPVHRQPQVLIFLAPEELKRFAPYATDALVPASDYFASLQRAGHSFHHRYKFVGRRDELAQLEAFVQDPAAKVLKLSAKGGEGKSRLLWELAHTVCVGAAAPQVLFLNPHSTGDLTLALWDKDQPRIIVVDDAHRLERVSAELLTLIHEGTATKLVLATRPQGNEALDERLREHGLTSKALELKSLKKKEVETLAAEALGPTLASRAKDLASLTGDSPFLTALAGDLLQRGQLSWGAWHSVEEFRAAVFRAFETGNLNHLGEADRKYGARLLRLLAVLAPVTPDTVFHERASACLGIPRVDVEALLQRMQAAGVVSRENQNIRVIPDLFSDFLVFDTAFDPQRRLPEFVREVLQQFSNHAAAILRNLAEASWVAGQQAPHRDELLRPLLDAEFARFDASNFYERGHLLEEWTAFSVFLPAESLALAEKALTQRTATRGQTPELQLDPDNDDGINSHRYVLSWIPSLLKPVALWHDQYRHVALDFLWKLGFETPRGNFGGGKNHPWAVIAEVLRFTPRKPPAIVESALDWVERLVQREPVKAAIASHRSVLSTLLEPCFARFVEFSEWQGRTVRWWQQPVNLTVTAPIRARALAILARLIEEDSWLLALDAVRAIERALYRVSPSDISRVRDAEKFRADWRPERLKALALLERVLQRHTHVIIQFAVRQLLLRNLAYEEDSEFSAAVRKVVALVPDSFDLRLATVINTQGMFEFAEQLGAPSGAEAQAKIKAQWQQHIATAAREFFQTLPTAADAIARLDRLADESLQAGHTPHTGEFMAALATTDPDCAVAIAEAMLAPDSRTRIAGIWQQILYALPSSHAHHAVRLIALAAEHPRTELRRGVVDYFRFRDRKEMTLAAPERDLLERMAAKAGPDELLSFVVLVQWIGPTCAAWGFELLGKLPLAKLPPAAHGELLAALKPYHAGDAAPPLHVVSHVLDALVEVPEIDVDHHGGGYERVAQLYPRAIYEFALKRAARYETLGPKVKYQALPRDILACFQLPGLEKEADFLAICAHLWERTMATLTDFMGYVWCELFQGIVLDHVDFWRPRFEAAVRASTSYEDLRRLIEILHFKGSLIVFRFPDLAKLILRRAEELAGTDGYERMRAALWTISGPQGRSYSNGELDKDSDYVEAEAIKSAAAHATDDVLGPFYRWIVDCERHERERSRRIYQASMASLDDE